MDQLELSAIDYVYSMGAFEPMSFVVRFEADLDAERIVDAFRTCARQFLGVSGVLVQRDPQTLFMDLTRDAAPIEICSEADAAPWKTQVDLVRTRLGEPLARARVTRQRAGGTLISLVLSHAVGDGYSFFLFFAAWAARCRTGEAAFEPVCTRSLLRPAAARAEPGSRRGSGELPHSGFFIDGEGEVRETWSWRPETLDGDVFAAKGQNGLSSNDLLSAALWKKSLKPGVSGQSTFCTLSDLRRYRQDIGPLFFGNAILPAKVAVDASVLRETSQLDVADWIRSAVAQVPSRIDQSLAELETLRLTEGVSIFRRFRPTDRHGITVTNMSRAPYAALDFGGGPPVEIEPVFIPSPDQCVGVLPATPDGGLRVLVALA